MKKEKKCSIIIRTKNEERWITTCLKVVFTQDYKNFEVIIIDNESVDKTVAKAKQFPIKRIVKIEKYFPGILSSLEANILAEHAVPCVLSMCCFVLFTSNLYCHPKLPVPEPFS